MIDILIDLIGCFSVEKKINSGALRKAAKEARQAEIERAREVHFVCSF